jgi:hypothetical protein
MTEWARRGAPKGARLVVLVLIRSLGGAGLGWRTEISEEGGWISEEAEVEGEGVGEAGSQWAFEVAGAARGLTAVPACSWVEAQDEATVSDPVNIMSRLGYSAEQD